MNAGYVEPVARPAIKWVGGKTQLLPELRTRMPKLFGRYYEPFVGGGALLFDLASLGLLGTMPRVRHETTWATINDSNAWLTTTYKAIRSEPERVITILRGYESLYRERGEAFYYDARAEGVPQSMWAAAACFIFLNKTGFNGLFRVNRKGEFNVPHGARKGEVTICDADNIRRVSKALQHVEITTGDFELAVKGATRGDFVYFDPPYVPVSASSDFTAYTKESFGPAEQTRLRDCALALLARGVKVMLSNADVPLVRKLYDSSLGFKVEKVMASRAVNSKGNGRGKVAEVVIT